MDPEHPGNPLANLEVLIVDDAVTVRRKLRSLLEEASIPERRIHEAGTAREALEAFEENVPDLVFLDLVLPDIPGEQIGSTLMDKHPDTSFVPLTALDSRDSRVRRLVSKGAVDVVEKPIRGDDFSELLKHLDRD